jgi:hypothetical protein
MFRRFAVITAAVGLVTAAVLPAATAASADTWTGHQHPAVAAAPADTWTAPPSGVTWG